MEDLPQHGDGSTQQCVARLERGEPGQRPGGQVEMVLDTSYHPALRPQRGQEPARTPGGMTETTPVAGPA